MSEIPLKPPEMPLERQKTAEGDKGEAATSKPLCNRFLGRNQGILPS
jgi:hypothetical protein